MISEFLDRNSGSYNVILFNLAKKSEFNIKGCNIIKEIMNTMNLCIFLVTFLLLGKPSDKCRPLKLTLSNPGDVYFILRFQLKLKNNANLKELKFSSDWTMLQREQMSKQRKELTQRKENGEPNIIIKYIKGEPTIILSKND